MLFIKIMRQVNVFLNHSEYECHLIKNIKEIIVFLWTIGYVSIM